MDDITLTETETACGVVPETVRIAMRYAHVIGDDTAVLLNGTPPAVATAAARHLLIGKNDSRTIRYEGLNGYGHHLYIAR